MEQAALTPPAARPADSAVVALPLSSRAIIAADRVIYGVSRHWLGWLNLFSGLYVGSLLLAPILAGSGHSGLARPIYGFNGLFCHQRADRSFHIAGHTVACCERCLAIYLAVLLVGLTFALLRGRFLKARVTDLIALSLPLLIDGLGQQAGLWESSAAARVITGALFGAAICWGLLPYLESGFARMRERIETLFERLVLEGKAAPLSQPDSGSAA